MSSAFAGRRTSVLRPKNPAMVVLVRGDVEVASWPLATGSSPDLDVVEELARWQLTAQRLGYAIRLRGAGVELWELLEFLGLAEVVTDADDPLA